MCRDARSCGADPSSCITRCPRRAQQMTRRSTGKTRVARAVWYARKGTVELRAAPLPRPQPGEALVRTLFSGISRGTERLVFNGEVGQSEWERMRCPNPGGRVPFPGQIRLLRDRSRRGGPGGAARARRCSACIRTRTISMRLSTPWCRCRTACRRGGRRWPPTWRRRSTRCGTAAPGPGDRIVVVGAGVVGLLVASLAARLPGAEVTAVDVDESRRPIVESLGARFARPAAGAAATPTSCSTPAPRRPGSTPPSIAPGSRAPSSR